MTYQQTIDYLFAQLPLFSRIGPAAYKKDLTNTVTLCAALGNPQTKFKSIHVAGTNGKGSVCHMLASALQGAGYKTGLYTSPHLYDFRERIRIDGKMIPEDFVVDFTERIRELMEEIQPSFFEITVAMAFGFFAQQEVDIAVIEVGLGGRLDSTNIITPLLSVITNIGWDHTNLLGNSLGAIASEKAGIIKHSVPVVIGERHPETEMIFLEKAKESASPIFFAEDLFTARSVAIEPRHRTIELQRHSDRSTQTFKLDLPGIYQEKNLCTVMAALDVLASIGMTAGTDQLHEALFSVRERTGLAGRWDVLREIPLLVLDVAHNKEGMVQLQRQLHEMRFGRLHLVFGVVRDKDIEAVLDLLPPAHRYYWTQAQIPRALPAVELREAASAKGMDGLTFQNVNDAIDEALTDASTQDLILVCGSIFLVAEVTKERYIKN